MSDNLPTPLEPESSVVSRAFGAENRRRLIDRYFAERGEPLVSDAWKHVYRLLLWADRTTGLAHCYESDKSQPGRHWYARSLRFHDWLSQQFGVLPNELTDELDWLFRHAVDDIAAGVTKARLAAAVEQRKPYAGRGFPEPGEDPDLEYIVLDAVGPWLHDRPPPEVLRNLSQRVHVYLGQENKRKNVLGEGFEDVLAAILNRSGLAGLKEATTRPPLHDVGGFYEPRGGEKARKVDLAVSTHGGRRVLVSAKWSVRADREEQFLTDFEAYGRLESSGRPFEYYWLTNEFDAARLVASCDRMVGNGPLFNAVVHIAPDAVLAAYGEKLARSQKRVPGLIDSGRLISLAQWLASLADPQP